MELPLRSAVVVVVAVGEWRTAQCHPGDRPRVQNGPDSHGALPRSRAHVSLNRYSLNWV